LHSSQNIARVLKEDKLAGYGACMENLIGTGCDGMYWIHHLSTPSSRKKEGASLVRMVMKLQVL
jgi:hypothetical protein